MQRTLNVRSAARFAVVLLLGSIALAHDARAHDVHEAFSAGKPGDPTKPSRTVKIVMGEDGKTMTFEPSRIEVHKGEQIRFVLFNDGSVNHEFVLATTEENRKHAALMKKFPNMEHDDPNAKRVSPLNQSEIFWSFVRTGEFEFACLIPGHYEAGMHGIVIVK
jgi:uncharacterized cupredoxin-like copper-binding protein